MLVFLTLETLETGKSDENIANNGNATIPVLELIGRLAGDHISRSKSKNTMFLGTKLKGTVYGIIANNSTSIAL